jgi:hypothetical protein
MHVIRYGIECLIISLFQVDSPQAGGVILRATQQFGII